MFITFILLVVFMIFFKVPTPYNSILLNCNPLAFLITSFRNALLYSQGVDVIVLLIWFVIGIVLSIIGIKIIYKHENTYVKVMRG